MIRKLLVASTALLMLTCTSVTSQVKNASRLREVRRVAVLPFVCSNPETGVAISEGLAAQLVTSRFTVIERGQLDRILSEQKVSLSGLLEGDSSQVGRLQGVDALILGSATVDRGYAGLAHGGRKDYVSSANARMVDVATGEVLVAATYSTPSARSLSAASSPSEVGAWLAKQLAGR